MTSQQQWKIKEEKYLPSDELKYLLSITEYIVKCISQNKEKIFFKGKNKIISRKN